VSLEDLEKRAVLKPVEAELDRQKEKAAKFKKKLHNLQQVAQDLVDTFNFARLIGDQDLAMEELKRAINESKE